MGISYDTPEDNNAWSDMVGFDFPLLSDPDKEVAALLDAKRPKTHPMFFVPRRITYLIDPEGTIVKAYDVGRNIEGHADEVLSDLREANQPEPTPT